MSAPMDSPGAGLSRAEKEAFLRRVLVERISQVRTVPASFAQERLWFLDRLHGTDESYNLRAALRFTGALDPGALERAVGEVVRRHEALRTTFAEVEGAAMQVIAPFRGFALPVEEPGGADVADVPRLSAQDARRPFDLAAGPLFRARLLRLAADEHVLLLAMHHAVSDGWSRGVLLREVAELYGAFREGRPSPLPEPAVQYADYAAWQREQLRGPALRGQLAYWTERLADAPALLELPADHPRPAVRTHRGAKHGVEVPGALRERLEALGRSEGATPYMVLLAAFQVLLSKYAGSEDIVVGCPVAGRQHAETEGLIGLFVNTLVLRTDLAGDPTFRALLRRVRATVLGAFQHQDVPFERLVAELRPERSLGHAPLFQVMFTLEPDAPAGAPVPGVEPLRLDPSAETSKFDLTLSLASHPGGLHPGGMHGVLEYSTELFEHGTIARMAGHFRRVLEQAAEDVDRPLSALELTDEAERRTVLEAWNRTDAAVPSHACIHPLFEAQAERTPDAVALVSEDASLTYLQLNERANRLAHALRRRGVGPEVRVGLCLERGAEMVVALLAVLKAGGAYVPLDPAYPAERLAFMLADSGAAVVLTQQRVRHVLPASLAAGVVSLDAAGDEIAGESAANPAGGAGPRSLAYLIYTSGSTGTPKGVAIEHASTVALLSWAAALHTAEELGGMLASTSLCFDLSVYELLLPLTRGGRVIVVENALALPSSPAAGEVRLVNTVPSAIASLLAGGGIPAGVTTVNLAGEPLRAELADALYAHGIRRVHDLYGPSEDTTYSTWTLRRAGGPATIGRPIHNTRAYVLDGGMRPLPVGMPGELYLGGRGLARGYLGRPARTAERFVPDPYGAAPGGRLYRTGDRVRWSADGTLAFLGRLDAQVKVRGFRVEPGEIEGALRRHPGVGACVVVAREDAPGDARLVAYVVAEADGEADGEALRAHLRRSLPEHMVPAAFVRLDALPLTPNGKLDRSALPAPAPASAAEGPVAPRTPAEELLAGIWGEVLRMERVDVHESFFALGGHSLLATRVIARVRAVLGVELPLRAVFEHPTVAELARAVDALRRADPPRRPPLVPVERGGPLPLSFAQERLWFLDRMEPGSPFYTLPAAVRLAGPLDVPSLERALGEVVRRHEALRTVLPEVQGAPVQVVVPFGGFALPVADLSALDAAAREAETGRRAAADAERPFDLAAGPLFRAALLRRGADDHVLLLAMHHAVGDEWSLGVLFRELAALYGAYREGRASPLAELTVQYADYAAWERAGGGHAVLERDLAYWRARLAGAPALLELPTDRPRPAVQTHRGAREAIELSGALLDGLRALGRGEGATEYMVLLAAFQALLSRYAGSGDVVVGSPAAGRGRRETEGLIGFFLDTLVLRTDLSGDPAFREVLCRAKAATLDAWDHREAPFERLVAELRPERSLSHAPLFQVMFVQASRELPRLPGVEAHPLAGAGRTSKFDLTLAAAARADGLGLIAEYATDLFDRGTIVRMLGHLRRVLEQAAADGGVRLSALELLDPAERRQLLAAWSGTAADLPDVPSFPRRFQARVREAPGAPAVTFGGETLGYGALNARANRLARSLARRGVGPDVRVGICLERGPEMIVAVLAVLKAGGACVPLDPAYPAPRLAFMAADSAVPVLLTQASLRDALPALNGVRVVAVDAEWPEIERERADDPTGDVDPRTLAYVLYTSGSTGTPKGVMMPHGGLAALVAWHGEGGGGALRTLQFAPLSFDVSFQEIAVTLAGGGELVLVDDDLRRDPPRLVRLLARAGVQRLFLPFVALQAVAEAAGDAPAPLSLREVVTAGEQLVSTPQVAKLVDAIPGCRLVNHYGPTETHVATAHALPAGSAAWHPLPPIGRPVPGTRVYVLDAALRPLPIGVPGELYVGGAQLARGYLGRPALTASRFVPDPFAPSPGGRLYATGDRARWRADGELEYLGRRDRQVKVRGFRVEPGEVEAVLRRHPQVADCAVIAREDVPGERRLVAYVVGGADAEALRAHLRAGLPEHMVPTAFAALDRLPLTPSGKLDRGALPAPAPATDEDRYVAPATPAEAALAEIWAEVLGCGRVGVRDDFFDLGGHSMLAARVAARVREAFAVELGVRALFEARTVGGLARLLSERGAAAPARAAGPRAEAGASPHHLLAVLDGLSEDDLDRLLAPTPEHWSPE